MKLDTDPFPIGMVELMNKKGLVHMDQAEMTRGKNMVVFDELRNRMLEPNNLEIGVWKGNVLWKLTKRVKPTSAMLTEKYQWQLEEDRRYRVTRGIKRDRFLKARNRPDQREPWHTEESWRRLVQHSMDWEPGIRQNSRFTDQSGLGNSDRRVNRPDVLHDREESSQRPK
jgi:hypothetical protein